MKDIKKFLSKIATSGDVSDREKADEKNAGESSQTNEGESSQAAQARGTQEEASEEQVEDPSQEELSREEATEEGSQRPTAIGRFISTSSHISHDSTAPHDQPPEYDTVRPPPYPTKFKPLRPSPGQRRAEQHRPRPFTLRFRRGPASSERIRQREEDRAAQEVENAECGSPINDTRSLRVRAINGLRNIRSRMSLSSLFSSQRPPVDDTIPFPAYDESQIQNENNPLPPSPPHPLGNGHVQPPAPASNSSITSTAEYYRTANTEEAAVTDGHFSNRVLRTNRGEVTMSSAQSARAAAPRTSVDEWAESPETIEPPRRRSA